MTHITLVAHVLHIVFFPQFFQLEAEALRGKPPGPASHGAVGQRAEGSGPPGPQEEEKEEGATSQGGGLSRLPLFHPSTVASAKAESRALWEGEAF